MLLSVALPILLVLMFLGKQFISFDMIGWNHGFQHPLEGWDHLITMLAVGIWAAQMRGHAIWMLPLAFVSVMSLGGLAGAAGLSIPSVEGIILLSCAVFSVLITRKIRFNAKINVLIVAFFAFFHGFAHGQEISTSASLISYTLGFMFATLLLHGAGIIAAKLIVLAAASLLTLFFANASQATPIEHTKPITLKIASLHEAEITQYSLSLNMSPQDSVNANQELFKADLMANKTSAAFVQDRLNSNAPVSLFAPTKNQATGFIIDKLQQHLQLSNVRLQLLNTNQESSVFTVVDEKLNQTVFSHINPVINNSPGTDLLSNGVGLTSPPMPKATVNITPLSDSFKSSLALIEESILQLLLTRLHQSLISSQVFHNTRHFCALCFEQKLEALNPNSEYIAAFADMPNHSAADLSQNHSPFSSENCSQYPVITKI